MPRGHALIVDDSSTARIILTRMLERADITTKGVASAEDAFSRLQSEHFDLIFLDHLLPGMNGFQALEKIKSQPSTRDIPVFMYTSQNAAKYIEDAKARGAAGVIGKQVDRDQLLGTIESILAGRHAEHTEPADEYLARNSLDVNTRRVTGRLATLEIAYEESHEEVVQLKQAINQLRLERQSTLEQIDEIDRKGRSRFRISIVLTLVVGILLGMEINSQAAAIDSINAQMALMRDVIAELVQLIR